MRVPFRIGKGLPAGVLVMDAKPSFSVPSCLAHGGQPHIRSQATATNLRNAPERGTVVVGSKSEAVGK